MEDPVEKMRQLKEAMKWNLRDRKRYKRVIRDFEGCLKDKERAEKVIKKEMSRSKSFLSETEDRIKDLQKEIFMLKKDYGIKKKNFLEHELEAKKILKKLYIITASETIMKKRFPQRYRALLHMRMLIARTVSRLPKKVKLKVIKSRPTFVLNHPWLMGMYCQPNKFKSNKPTILLNFYEMMYYHPRIDMHKADAFQSGVIAHELAHFILKHKSIRSLKDAIQGEKQAENLARDWLSEKEV